MKKTCTIIGAALFVWPTLADTETINWYVDGSVYDTTVCTVGGDVNLPTTPTKTGYTFRGWLDGYTLLQYVTGNGGSISTGVAPGSTTRVITHMSGNIAGDIFGVYYVNKFFYTSYQTSNSVLYDYYGQSSGNRHIRTCAISSSIMEQGIIIDKNGSVTDVYDTDGKRLCNLTVYHADASLDREIIFPGHLHENSGARGVSNYTFYFLKIYNNGTLVRNYIPVKRNSDNAVGMYDLVQNQFITPSGGSFTAGPAL